MRHVPGRPRGDRVEDPGAFGFVHEVFGAAVEHRSVYSAGYTRSLFEEIRPFSSWLDQKNVTCRLRQSQDAARKSGPAAEIGKRSILRKQSGQGERVENMRPNDRSRVAPADQIERLRPAQQFVQIEAEFFAKTSGATGRQRGMNGADALFKIRGGVRIHQDIPRALGVAGRTAATRRLR